MSKPRPNLSFLCVACSVLLIPPALCADTADYLGAEAVLAKAAEIARSQPAGEQKWPAPLRTFCADVPLLPPAQIARRWLELFDTAASLEKAARGGQEPTSPRDGEIYLNEENALNCVFLALPGPAVWESLAAQIEARTAPGGSHAGEASWRELLLHVYGELLVNHYDRAGQMLLAAADRAPITLEAERNGRAASCLESIYSMLVAAAGDPAGELTLFQREFDRFLAAPDSRELDFPDLVALCGEEKAESFLRRALLACTDTARLRNPHGERTRALARRIALDLVDQLRCPPWDFTLDPNAVDLFEALSKRFPPENAPENTRTAGYASKIYYLFGLIEAGRDHDATDVALSFTDDAFPRGRYGGHEVGNSLPDARRLEEAGT